MFLSFLFCLKSFKKRIDLLLCCVIIESSKGKQLEKENKIMTKYNVVFKDGTERTYTSEQFKNRLDVNNYLITSGMAKSIKE